MFPKECEEIGFDCGCVSFCELGREQVAVSFEVLVGRDGLIPAEAASKSAFRFFLGAATVLLELSTCRPDFVKGWILS
jgi:hypothetical protein